MKTKYNADFFRHICNLQTLAGLSSYHEALMLYKRLRRLECKIARENEKEADGYPVYNEIQAQRVDKRRLSLIQSFFPGLNGIFLEGDPRGYAIKLNADERYKLMTEKDINLYMDWGHNGIFAPEF